VPGPITSGFGPRWGSFHYGLDIGAGFGTPIHAAAAGTVIYAGWYDGFGNFVIVDHGGGLSTTYGHQSQIAVSVGEHVEQGQLIGYVGSTGFSTGPHLDFEVRVNGTPVDPLGYL
jgi:murein DD-endopeptidase MepM/ murein hydrolase activator NlpD